MARERLRKRREAALEAEEQLIQSVAEREELRSLHGQLLDLTDDSPNWFMNRLLRREGVSHPLIERGRDVDDAITDAWRILEPLRRRYERLAAEGEQAAPRDVSAYNLRRAQALDDVRGRLPEVNRLIRDHNLMVPDAMHRRPFPIEETMERLERDFPALPEAVSNRVAEESGRRRRLFDIIRRRGG
jgi:hypothetical protein